MSEIYMAHLLSPTGTIDDRPGFPLTHCAPTRRGVPCTSLIGETPLRYVLAEMIGDLLRPAAQA